jgi:hypothetical protein
MLAETIVTTVGAVILGYMKWRPPPKRKRKKRRRNPPKPPTEKAP